MQRLPPAAKAAKWWQICTDSRHPAPLLSNSAVGSAPAADWVVYVLHRPGGEWCMHQRYFLCRLVFGCGFCTTNRCGEDEPRRLIRTACPVEEPVGGGFGLALVWERGGQEDRRFCSAMVVRFSDLGVLSFERDCPMCLILGLKGGSYRHNLQNYGDVSA